MSILSTEESLQVKVAELKRKLEDCAAGPYQLISETVPKRGIPASYLVKQKKLDFIFRFVRFWDGQEWKDLKEEKYGVVIAVAKLNTV